MIARRGFSPEVLSKDFDSSLFMPPPNEVPSLAVLSLQAIFKGTGRRPKWGPLRALVEIQLKWIRLRLKAILQAAEIVTESVRSGYPSGIWSSEHVRRYRRIGLALRTSQARVHTLAITQRV